MYDISIYIYQKNQPNVGKYHIHGSYGIYILDTRTGPYLFCYKVGSTQDLMVWQIHLLFKGRAARMHRS